LELNSVIATAGRQPDNWEWVYYSDNLPSSEIMSGTMEKVLLSARNRFILNPAV
jgi:hypothetical protein